MTRKRAVIALVTAAAACAGVLVAFLSPSSGNSAAKVVPTTLFSAFSAPSSRSVDGRVQAIAGDLGADAQDLSSVRTFASGLGRFQSRLVAFRSFQGQNICYSLLAAERTNPGMSYCYRPFDPDLPVGLRGEHFSVSALESRTGPNRDLGTQVFGVVENSVVGTRVQVGGVWRAIAITNNAIYLDLPGVPRSDLGKLEVRLSDGSTQQHDFQTGL